MDTTGKKSYPHNINLKKEDKLRVMRKIDAKIVFSRVHLILVFD